MSMSAIRILPALACSLVAVSCSSFQDDENYDTGGYDTSNPYGSAAVNPPADTNPTYGHAAYEETSSYHPAPDSTAPVASAPAAPIPATASTHTVVKGDTLWGLGQKYGVSVDAIRQVNGMATADNNIRIGQTLNIPAP